MNKRLLKIAETLAAVIAPEEVIEPPQDLDLQADDLANRLDEAVLAINDCVAILTQLGMDKDRAVEKMLDTVKNEVRGPEAISGGLAEGRPDSDFDPKQLEKGIKIEVEHSGNKEQAKEIAKDHLSESPTYYDYLEEMEKKMDKEKE